jgi:hypothetical protein
MNRSNAVTLGGGAQMNRFTDGVNELGVAWARQAQFAQVQVLSS